MAIELHCHSLFSVDGRGTPEDLVDAAADRGITALALTDHNSLGGVSRARAQADRRGIRFLSGVELDAYWNDRSYHFLAIGFDPEDAALTELADRNFSVYGHSFGLYLEQFPAIGHPDLQAVLREALPDRYPTHPGPVLNQWFARDVLLEQGLLADGEAYTGLIREARSRVVEQRGADVFRRFTDLDEALSVVHGAGGILVLAHVANYLQGDAEAQLALVRDGIRFGLDGFELYHPINRAEPHFDRLATLAEEVGCAPTGGSDCHDASQTDKNPIGCADVPDSLLDRIDEALDARRR